VRERSSPHTLFVEMFAKIAPFGFELLDSILSVVRIVEKD
jgi:hypothetical protein